MIETDFIVIGAGIVGLSVAYHLRQRFPKASIVVLEKEMKVASHQSGRNSGVIHSGIYYKPGSSKAINCRKGKKALEDFCAKNKINFKTCGKVIVATKQEEIESLTNIYNRGKQNEINCEMISAKKVQEIEPYVTKAIVGIHVPETGIVDYKEVCSVLMSVNPIIFNQKVAKIYDDVLVTQDGNRYQFGILFNCAGLYSDKIAEMAGVSTKVKIIPFRGDYYTLKREDICRGLIYPVPDQRFPFLGVHFTKMIGGGVECGPTAMLALSREFYNKSSFNLSEFFEIINYSGTLKLMKKHLNTGFHQYLMSLFKFFYLKELRKLIPDVKSEDLIPREPGIRAQALDEEGNLVDDFVVHKHKNSIHVLNAPSPAATASLTIGQKIVDLL